jgi:hypothetical protein
VKSRAPKTRKPWTGKERDYLIAHAAEESKVLARRLGRTVASIRNAKKRWRAVRKDYRGRADRQHFHNCYCLGYSDAHIARLMGVSPDTVRRLRVSMGKPANGWDKMSFKAREKRRKQRAKAERRAATPKIDRRWNENVETEERLNAMIEERMKTLPKWWARETEKQEQQARDQ